MQIKKRVEEVPTNTLIVVSTVITVMIVIFGVALAKGLADKLARNNEVIRLKRDVDRQLSANLEALQSLQVEYQNLGDDRVLIAQAVPSKSDYPSLVSMMESLANASGVTLNSVSPSPESTLLASEGPAPYTFNVTITANYDAFKQFLRSIEVSMRPLAINNVTISGQTDALTADIVLTTYYQSPVDVSPKTKEIQPGEAVNVTIEEATR